MVSVVAVQDKNKKHLRRRKGVYESFSSRLKSRESFYTDNSLEFGTSCEDL